jgi:probable rRNA maturation factor
VNFNIRFFSEEINFVFKHKIKTRKWLTNVVREENSLLLDLNYIFCSDNYLSDLNKKYLNHNSFTDILTFPDTSDQDKISGDIYISVERIKDNAEKYTQPFDKELARVMVHGLLHLLGYRDKTSGEKKLMTMKEDYYLTRF